MHTEKTAPKEQHTNWIDILLDTPVSDGRHRIIGYILAPYLINEKHLDVDAARRIIEGWVERSEEAYGPPWGNIKAFIKRECIKTSESGRKPRDLARIKKDNLPIYRTIVNIAESYGIDIE